MHQNAAIGSNPALSFRVETLPRAGKRYQPATAPWATRAVKRAQRALGRQAPVIIALVLVGALLGAAYHLLAHADPLFAYGSGLSFGLAVGACLALAREFGRNAVGLSNFDGKSRYLVLGAAPELSAGMMRDLAPDQRTPLGCLLHQPASNFATALRDLQASLADKQVVAFIGSTTQEGATTTALGVAISAAQQGRSVIVVDCDVRRRSLTRAIGATPELGVADVADAPERWREALTQEPETGLDVIPAAQLNNVWRNLFHAQGFAALLRELRNHYDLILLDCPPALSADGAMIARGADKCVMVATWDETPVSALNDTLRALGRMSPAAAAVFVNRVPPRYKLARA